MLGSIAQIAPINAMGRVGQRSIEKAASELIRKEMLKAPVNKFVSWISPSEWRTYGLLKDMQDKAKDGVFPTDKEFNAFRKGCVDSYTNMINVPDQSGKTLLGHVVNNISACPIARKKCISDLRVDGAQLNPRDEYTMGTMANLAYVVNKLRLNASASSIVQTYRTLLTKNTYEKLEEKVRKGIMTRAQVNDRKEFVKKAEDVYAKAAREGLLVARRLERELRKK